MIERYTLSLTASGPALLEALTAPTPERPRSEGESGGFLVVGNVDYGAAPSPTIVARADGGPGGRTRSAGSRRGPFVSLGSARGQIRALQSAPGPRPLVLLEGPEASASRVIRELPRARWAHFATHGFFDAEPPASPIADLPMILGFGEGREALGGSPRNPLLSTGLVLAGANPRSADLSSGSAEPEEGILTAEALSLIHI